MAYTYTHPCTFLEHHSFGPVFIELITIFISRLLYDFDYVYVLCILYFIDQGIMPLYAVADLEGGGGGAQQAHP